MNKLTAAILIIMIGAHAAVADERPFVSNAVVYVSGGRIVCDVSCGGLFSEKIAGTVQSGLPAVVELLYSLEKRDGNTADSGIHSFELGYDVWENIYSVRAGDSTKTFGSFEKMQQAVEQLRRVPIVPVEIVDPAAEYSVQLTIAVHPLSGREKQRIEGFVEETMGAQSRGSWHEQVLNINELIGWFFSRDKKTSNQSDVFRTEYIAPRALPDTAPSNDRGGGGHFGNLTIACEVR